MSEFDVYAAMQEDKEPLARYAKTITGKVQVTAINPFSDAVEHLLLEGSSGERKSYIDLWTTKQLVFFERMNEPHIKAGRLTKISTKHVEQEVSPNQLTDDEIDTLLSNKLSVLQAKVKTFTDTAPILRLINRARELDKSERVIKYLEEQMSRLELEKYS